MPAEAEVLRKQLAQEGECALLGPQSKELGICTIA